MSEAPARLRVLLVDDERPNLDTFVRALRRDLDVTTALSAEEALQKLSAGGVPDVLVTDHSMPQMTGVELLARVKDRHPDVARVMLTAFGDLPAVMEALRTGLCHARLGKPWDRAEVLATLQRVQALSRLREAVSSMAPGTRRP